MKFTTAPMTPEEAGKFLRTVAEMTARNSRNWDNFEAIAADLIKSAYEGGGDARSLLPKTSGNDVECSGERGK
jgi:hypothetical protein